MAKEARKRAERDAGGAGKAPPGGELVPCAGCRGELPAREDCSACGGLGAVKPPEEELPEEVIACAAFLRARARLERFGLAGWKEVDGIEHVDPVFVEALEYFDAELEAERS